MGLVNSPSFNSSEESQAPKPKKSKKAEPVTESVPEECCTLGCDDCIFAEEPVIE